MKYMVCWSVPPGCHKPAANEFLSSGAPMPEGLRALGRWHAPGSVEGWLLCETDDPSSLWEHVAQWANLLDFDVTPVVEDEQAGAALARVYGG